VPRKEEKPNVFRVSNSLMFGMVSGESERWLRGGIEGMQVVAGGDNKGGVGSIHEVAKAGGIKLGGVGEDVEAAGMLDVDVDARINGDLTSGEDGLRAIE